MEIIRNGSQPSAAGPAEFFAGKVRIDSPFKGVGGANMTGATVTFEPGARRAGHTQPLGQTLIVTSGKGWTQCEGGPIVVINAGDIICCPSNHRHWHHGDDPYRHPAGKGRQSDRVDGEGDR